MTWDPDQYDRFDDHRLRPGLDLIARIPATEPRRVVDLGCGTGTLTAVLARRWPSAHIVGLDASRDMLERVPNGVENVQWQLGDIGAWRADEPCDLIFSNAALHWLDDHEALFRRLAGSLAPRGVLAVQMPDNWAAPSHRIPAAVLAEGDFSDAARAALITDRVASPSEYRRWLGAGLEIDMWSTTYHQVLRGTSPVLEWVKGTVLRPVLDTLDDQRGAAFVEECDRRYRSAYPRDADGVTMLAFRRLFIVARRP
ncbi:MAG: methyltransferase domain-containing protein [Acidimicrobiia bacterium]